MASEAIPVLNVIAKGFQLVNGLFTRAHASRKKDLRELRARKQFEQIYAPLRLLLLDVHITTCQGIKYPYFSTRVKRAMRLTAKREYRRACAAILDKGKTELSGEVEYGPFFELTDVKKIIVKNPELVDPKLLNLYQAADRAQYEQPKSDFREIIAQELQLIDYILERYNTLSSRYAP